MAGQQWQAVRLDDALQRPGDEDRFSDGGQAGRQYSRTISNRADLKVSCRLLDASRGTYEAISHTPDSWPGIVTGEAPSTGSVSEVPSEITDALAQNY